MNRESASSKPWLLIDIDGVLNPDWSNTQANKHGIRRIWHATDERGNRYRMLLNPEHGRWLLDMQDVFRLAWCTTWMHLANGPIRRRLLLPDPLPVVEFDFRSEADGPTKIPGILRFVGEDPFCWLDDDVTDRDLAMLRGIRNQHLLVDVDPFEGLQPEHLAAARSWAEQIG